LIYKDNIYKTSSNSMLEEDMKKYKGEYILIEGDFESKYGKIVEHNKSAYEIMKKSEKYHKNKVYITYSPLED